MVGPFTFHEEGLADTYKGESADYCDGLASPSGGAAFFTGDPCHGIETVLVAVCNPLNCALHRKHVHPPGKSGAI